MSTVTEVDQRAYIKICTLHGDSASTIHQTLLAVCGESALHYSTVARWAKQFKEGREETEDQPRAGRPKSATGSDVLPKLQERLDIDRRQTCCGLAESLGISAESVRTMLEDDLQMPFARNVQHCMQLVHSSSTTMKALTNIIKWWVFREKWLGDPASPTIQPWPESSWLRPDQ